MSRDPVYSTLRVLEERLDTAAEKGIMRLSVNDLKGVVTWLENHQHHISYQTATEDDPVQNAKGRGKVELLLELADELMRLASHQQDEKEE